VKADREKAPKARKEAAEEAQQEGKQTGDDPDEGTAGTPAKVGQWLADGPPASSPGVPARRSSASGHARAGPSMTTRPTTPIRCRPDRANGARGRSGQRYGEAEPR
jgi:hypothetical protein